MSPEIYKFQNIKESNFSIEHPFSLRESRKNITFVSALVNMMSYGNTTVNWWKYWHENKYKPPSEIQELKSIKQLINRKITFKSKF